MLLLGMTEVRGVFLPPHLHAALKEHAQKLNACRTEQDCTQPEACKATGGCERVEDVERAAEVRVRAIAQRRELLEPGIRSVQMTIPELIAFGVECAL